MRETYNSVRRNAILDLIKQEAGAFTAKDLAEKLRQTEHDVALSTIYRALETFLSAGLIIKNTDSDGQVSYLYTAECEESGHCFLKCSHCGAVEHVDCGVVSELTRHIFEGHHFLIDGEKVVLPGICKKCNKVGDC